jgi:hypothetical protein
MICSIPKFKVEVVSEENPIVNMQDGILYVVSEQVDKMFVDELVNEVQRLKEGLDKDGLIYSYDIDILSKSAEQISSGPLFDAIQNGVNVVLPICTPNVCEKKYIVAELKAHSHDILIPSMVMMAENYTKESIKEALLNLAVNEPEKCEELLINNLYGEKQDEKSGGFWGILFPDIALGSMAAALSPLVDYHVSKDLSYKDTKEIIGRFVKNWNTVLRLEGKDLTPKQAEMLKKAESECKYVFDQFDTSVYYNFSKQISRNKNVLLAYEKTIDRDKIARNSNVKVLVQPPLPEIEDKIDSSIKNKLKTNGKYRVYLQKDEKTVQVKFGRSSSCVIYIMYLLDRKKQGDNIDTLEIVNNKELFTSLYTQIYNDYDVKKACKTIWTTKANSSKNKLSDYYVNIRESLINAVSEFKEESSLPFYIPNKYSHITVLSDNITISDDIKLTGERCGF